MPTPRRLREMGLGELVKEYPEIHALPSNPGLHKIGFSAWKPFIILHAAQSMQPGDIVFYLDANIMKYAGYRSILGSIEEMSETALRDMDFYVGREQVSDHLKNFHLSNRHQLDELGRGSAFVKNFSVLIVNNIIIRKSQASEDLLWDWLALCRVDRFIMPPLEHERHEGFGWFCPEQSVLNTMLARHIEEGLLPWWYPNIMFGRSNKMEFPQNSHVAQLALSPIWSATQPTLRQQYEKEISSTKWMVMSATNANTSVVTKHWENVAVPLSDWLAADDAVVSVVADGTLIIADGMERNFHLMRIEDDRFEKAEIELEITASAINGGTTGLHVQHWGGLDVCTFMRDGQIERCSDSLSEWLDRSDGEFRCRVRFYNFHSTVSIGCGNPNGHYQGEGRPQFNIKSILIRIR